MVLPTFQETQQAHRGAIAVFNREFYRVRPSSCWSSSFCCSTKPTFFLNPNMRYILFATTTLLGGLFSTQICVATPISARGSSISAEITARSASEPIATMGDPVHRVDEPHQLAWIHKPDTVPVTETLSREEKLSKEANPVKKKVVQMKKPAWKINYLAEGAAKRKKAAKDAARIKKLEDAAIEIVQKFKPQDRPPTFKSEGCPSVFVKDNGKNLEGEIWFEFTPNGKEGEKVKGYVVETTETTMGQLFNSKTGIPVYQYNIVMGSAGTKQ
ncbi:hypothetical protein BDP27DRAFT_696524 [Rhodocollybia butyracea]|uniref:Uncharacterized protein n=1 Tax=Rhodocollybia butyracea TaxID=206335 RepID=A0A9P5P3H0_9AGAR|nr:hypothetical protein BDP27DRAFT_696524 [Rhodocollybia butyracea]